VSADQVRAYANGWYQVERTPEAIAERARQVIKMGYTALKIDPFGAGSYEMSEPEKCSSVEIVSAVREAIGADAELFVEMHGRFAPHTAIDMCHRLAPYRPGWFEEPVPPENTPGTPWKYGGRSLRSEFRLPPANDFSRVIFISICFVNALLTSFSPTSATWAASPKWRKIAAMAEAHYMPLAPHNACSHRWNHGLTS
jgi:galactonate dehydratase